MSPPASGSSDWDPEELGPSLEEIFDIQDPDPYELQQSIHSYLSQETRHHILQVILGHPSHLVSMTEFAYFISRSRSTIREHLLDLAAHRIIKRYDHEPNEGSRDLPAAFWGFTEMGVALLDEFRYLRGLPVMRAAHDATIKSETVERHEAAPRPTLPSTVAQPLEYGSPEPDDELPPVTESLEELRSQSIYAEAAPADPLNRDDTNDGTRSLDELF